MAIDLDIVSSVLSLVAALISVVADVFTLLVNKDSTNRLKALGMKLYTFSPVVLFFIVALLIAIIENGKLLFITTFASLIIASLISFNLFVSKSGAATRQEIATLVMYQATCVLYVCLTAVLSVLMLIGSK